MSYTMSPDEVSADNDAELADCRCLLRDGSGDLEPLERVTLLETFCDECAVWYEWCDESPCVKARRGVYIALLYRHSEEKVEQYRLRIEAILDAAEAEVYAIVRDGCPLCVSHVLGDRTVGPAYITGPGRRVHSVVHGGGVRSSLRPCLSGHGAEEVNNA